MMFRVNIFYEYKYSILRFPYSEDLVALHAFLFVAVCHTSHKTYRMPIPPSDQLEQRIRAVTRSGRAVRQPVRYEPDPDQIFDDDYSDAPSGSEEEEWGIGMHEQTDIGDDDDDDDDMTNSDESHDSSYESNGTLSSEEESGSSSDGEDFFAETDVEEDDEDEEDDVLEWETLTVDASEPSYSSADDQDL